jgi:DEAD/DEAH box helicase domain-containing protein
MRGGWRGLRRRRWNGGRGRGTIRASLFSSLLPLSFPSPRLEERWDGNRVSLLHRNIDPVEALTIREVSGGATTACYGTVKSASSFFSHLSFTYLRSPPYSLTVEAVVFGYFKVDKRVRLSLSSPSLLSVSRLSLLSQNNILDTVDLHSPPFIRTSHGLWLDIPRLALEILLLKNFHPAGAIHAAEHALMSLTPIFAMCSEGDVRTECKQPQKELAGVGTTRKRPARCVFSHFLLLLRFNR